MENIAYDNQVMQSALWRADFPPQQHWTQSLSNSPMNCVKRADTLREQTIEQIMRDILRESGLSELEQSASDAAIVTTRTKRPKYTSPRNTHVHMVSTPTDLQSNMNRALSTIPIISYYARVWWWLEFA